MVGYQEWRFLDTKECQDRLWKTSSNQNIETIHSVFETKDPSFTIVIEVFKVFLSQEGWLLRQNIHTYIESYLLGVAFYQIRACLSDDLPSILSCIELHFDGELIHNIMHDLIYI